MWVYEAEFTVTEEMQEKKEIDLVLEGVDTVADIHVNGNLVGKLNNAHRQAASEQTARYLHLQVAIVY